MEEKRIDLKLEIKFMSPFHIGSGISNGKFVDSLVLVDNKGLPYLPASSFKGKVKANLIRVINTLMATEKNNDFLEKEPCSANGEEKKICKDIDPAKSCLICRLFGSAFTPGALMFSDFKLADQKLLDFIDQVGGSQKLSQHLRPTRSANRIDRRLKTAAPKALFNFETANFKYSYRGQINGRAYISQKELELFKNSLALITHLGGSKAKGLGRCEIRVK